MILHIKTPLIYSPYYTKIANRSVYLKLENLQPAGSFKLRGIGHTCTTAIRDNGFKNIIGSSGGNAGMAMAYCAQQLKVPATIFIPTSTPKMIIDKLKDLGANVRVSGENWNAANDLAMDYIANDSTSFMVHPFNQETTFIGHSTIVHEIQSQLKDNFNVTDPPYAVGVAVGGGGLAAGVLFGLEQVGWKDTTTLITMETHGADCFYKSVNKGEIVTLSSIDSICTSLGALSPLPKLFDYAVNGSFRIVPHVTSDKETILAVEEFANVHRMLVEPACGAAMNIVDKVNHRQSNDDDDNRPLIIVVCGGNIISTDLLIKWKNQFNDENILL